MSLYRLGDNKVSFTNNISHSGSFDGTYKLDISFGDASQFTESDYKIVFGGVPLSLSQYTGDLPNPWSENTSAPSYLRVYALKTITKSTITSVNPSNPETFSAVLDGTRINILQDTDGKLYLDVNISGETSIISDYTTFKGIPIALGVNNEIVCIDSGYSESEIEEYTKISIGGLPISVGRIGNNWFLIIV